MEVKGGFVLKEKCVSRTDNAKLFSTSLLFRVILQFDITVEIRPKADPDQTVPLGLIWVYTLY